ncbi:Predicted N-acetyltransferase YhbS [Tindallia magadiensis]|uniref:Predicted N-acetyltransferase YhbS n=1 Tax=Tindallia magadiensis TaxID=69895 RepID=A0A1I3C2K3_9FIRM|nr:N-acetyltransferase [Tindallia magadiensis]SFH68546.1 Predicted N-acetyltransferase YhbS [Tindallia magadiensis]
MEKGMMEKNLMIRPEGKEDYMAIRQLIQDAFDPMPFSTGKEWQLVESIRASKGYINELALVAELGGKMVGHILVSEIALDGKTSMIPVLILSPVSVLPEFQREGVGQQLCQKAIEEAKKTDYPVMIVIGDPRYYQRFGFRPAFPEGVYLPFGFEEEYLQMMELKENALEKVAGAIQFPPWFFDARGELL